MMKPKLNVASPVNIRDRGRWNSANSNDIMKTNIWCLLWAPRGVPIRGLGREDCPFHGFGTPVLEIFLFMSYASKI